MILLQTVNLWIHVVSFSVWIGSTLFFLFVFAPSAHSLPPKPAIDILNRGRRSFQTLSWITITLLLITGISNFVIFGILIDFTFGPSYYQILGIKLLLFLSMVLHHGFQTFKYAPRIASLSAQTTPETSAWPKELLYLWRKWFVLLKINATLGPIVLLLALGLTMT